ncbi:MAG: hypothetical protein UIM53_06115 [Acutalibacteraceae bacterium]|nr:hypothetical protein [Acutalibacteraceae bacterium]
MAPRKKITDYLGQEQMQECGQKCKVIEAVSGADITVQFEDGTVVRHKKSVEFTHGKIRNPNIKIPRIADPIGLKVKQNCGLMAEIIECKTRNDLTVKFEDGAIREHIQLSSFRMGQVAHPSKLNTYDKNARLGERTITRDGFEIEITAYRNCRDIDVTFLIDGSVVTAEYVQFKRANIQHPTIKSVHNISFQEFAIGYYLYQIGFIKVNMGAWRNKGFGQFELDFYHPDNNIAIEHDGSIHFKTDTVERDIRKNQKCKEFGIKLYRLRKSNLPVLTDGNSINYILNDNNNINRYLNDCVEELTDILSQNNIDIPDDFINFRRDYDEIMKKYQEVTVDYYRNTRIGEIKYSEKHQQMIKIIEYRNYLDIDVEFMADKLILNHNFYQKFQEDKLPHPTTDVKHIASRRVGEVKKQKNGHVCKIIKYNAFKDITVQFEDGTIREHISYGNFQNGTIGYLAKENPKEQAKNRINTSKIMNNGLECTIIAYRNSRDIDVKYSNGMIQYHKTYCDFVDGSLNPYGRKNIWSGKINERNDEIIKRYNNNESIKSIAKNMHISPSTVSLLLEKMGLKRSKQSPSQ